MSQGSLTLLPDVRPPASRSGDHNSTEADAGTGQSRPCREGQASGTGRLRRLQTAIEREAQGSSVQVRPASVGLWLPLHHHHHLKETPMPAPYAWVITKDHLATDPGDHDDTGRAGPRNATDEQIAQAKKTGRAFRMYDDDGELYFSGRLLDPSGENEFAPLDDYGMPGAGATEIRYFVGRRWVSL